MKSLSQKLFESLNEDQVNEQNDNINEGVTPKEVMKKLKSMNFISMAENPDIYDYDISAEGIHAADKDKLDDLYKAVLSFNKTAKIEKDFIVMEGFEFSQEAITEAVEEIVAETAEEVNEAKRKEVNEGEDINSDEEFIEYGEKLLKEAHGEDFDKEKSDEMLKGILKDCDGDYGKAVGKLQSSLG